ncbi:hypothetical protein CMO88_04395 [Candidatus Woesearchaeota archaeon]|jgi:hypothetical protein|nr:hypothetical protein [Candidatus Woesearchaeota archaeon]|tara:strand:- start:8801 stop:9136 length:336 start_codon:yes stop_codon:yes gene_type:complete
MKKRERDLTWLYVTMFWTSWAIVAIWIVLKAIGVINSPVWQELVPFVGIIFGAGVFFQMFLDMRIDVKGIKKKIGRMDRDTGHLRIDVEVLKNDVGSLKQDASSVKTKLHF